MRSLIVPLVLLASALGGCSYGTDITTEVTRLTDAAYDPVDGDVALYFAPETPDFEFVKIARIEMTGNYSASVNRLLELMKARARREGGEAVIHIERTFRSREMGVIGGSDPDTYDAVVLSGLVVRPTAGR